MDYAEFSEDLAADTDPANADPGPGEPGYWEQPPGAAAPLAP
jgi:hypothetical protein